MENVLSRKKKLLILFAGGEEGDSIGLTRFSSSFVYHVLVRRFDTMRLARYFVEIFVLFHV